MLTFTLSIYAAECLVFTGAVDECIYLYAAVKECLSAYLKIKAISGGQTGARLS